MLVTTYQTCIDKEVKEYLYIDASMEEQQQSLYDQIQNIGIQYQNFTSDTHVQKILKMMNPY